MTQEELVALYPRLWHMAHEGSWPSIRDRGLMSVSAMLDEYNVPDKERSRTQVHASARVCCPAQGRVPLRGIAGSETHVGRKADTLLERRPQSEAMV